MTVIQLRNSMSMEELFAWSAYCSLKSEREGKEMEKARQQAQYRRVR
jgi:hypothetical protein